MLMLRAESPTDEWDKDECRVVPIPGAGKLSIDVGQLPTPARRSAVIKALDDQGVDPGINMDIAIAWLYETQPYPADTLWAEVVEDLIEDYLADCTTDDLMDVVREGLESARQPRIWEEVALSVLQERLKTT